MADNKKNQEALEALHRLQDAQAATSTVTKTDWKAASQSADSFIETANTTADNIRSSYTKDVDGNYISSFLTDSRKHLNGATSAKTRMGVGTSRSVYESRKKESDDLRNRSYVISRYLDDHKDDFDEETYKSLKNYLDTFDKVSSQSIHEFYSNDKFYSQFSTKEEYDKYVTQKAEYEKAVNLDLKAAEKEIADLEAQRDDFYWNHEYDATNHRERVAFDEALKERDAQIAQKKQYLNQAKRIQESAKLSSVADPFSDSYDHNFKDLSKYSTTIGDSSSWWKGRTEDTQYEWINNQNGFRDSYEKDMDALNQVAAATSQSSFFVAPTESVYRKQGYDQLTKNEIAIYNYYYAKEGKEKAQEYLDNIQETLNYRKATTMYGELEDQTALELAFGMQAGLDQFSSGLRNLFNTEDNYIPQSATQMASGMVREDLADAGAKLPDWMGGASLGQVGYDAITTTANMAPSILTSMAVGMLNPVAGQVAGHALMGMSAAGGAYQEALNEGYDKNQARGYGLLVGASEIVMEKVLGGISALGGNALGKTLTSNLGNADTALKMIAKKLGGSMLSEFGEEYLQEVLTPVFQNLMLGTDNEVKLLSAEALYSGILGALTAGIMEGPTAIAGEVKVTNTGKQLQKADISAQRLADIGKTFAADTVAYKLAGKVNENTGAYTMGRLFNEIGATLTEQNKADITKALTAEGMSVDIAKRHAEIMSDIFEGGEVSDIQMKMIEKNDVLSKVMKEVLIDENSTVNQRTIGYNDTLKALANEMSGVDTSRTEQTSPGQENAPASDKVVTENKQTTQSQYEASADGKTIIKSTGETVGIKEVATIKDGQMTLKLTDGRTVDANDVSYASESEALVYEAVANMGVNATAANVLVNAYHPGSGVAAGVYAHGIKEAYRYGQYSYPVQELAKGPFSSMLTEHQRNTAYKLGKLFGGKQVAKEQATILKNRTVATTEKSSATGKVHFDGDRNALTERQNTSLSTLETVADVLGVQIYVFESKVGENGKRIGANGWFDPKDNSIHIDLHAGMRGEATMLFTAAHELTHFIKQWSPAKFKTLANFLMKEYGQKGVSVDVLVHNQIAKAKRSGRTISYDVAFEEVVADSMETMLADGNVVEKLAKLKQQDKSLWQKIKDFISDLAAKIRSVYEGLTPDSQEGHYVAEMVDSIEKLQELFTEGLVEASENYQASLTPGEEGVVVNQSGDPVAQATADGTVQLSMRTYEEDGRAALRNYLQKCVNSKKLTKAEMQEMMDGIEDIYEVCKEFKDKYAPFSAWSDAAVVRDTRGKPVFSVVTPNGDYKMNLDFSLVCKKRRTLDAVFNEMSRRGIIDDFELGQKSVVKINEIIRKYGLETACALCFVDAKRFRQASMADSFTNLYNELVESLVPEDQKGNIDHFNFSGYATIKKVEGGIDTWDNSKLDFSHINHVLKTYGDGTVEYKAAKYIKNNPKGRKLLLRGDFMSSQGFDAVKSQNQDILKLYNSKKGTGGPKAAFGDVQYLNEVIQKARWWTPAKAYAVGGVRIQSFSDYVPRMVFDYTQMIYDLAATKLPAHAYTKEALFVKQFGLTGVKINMSLIPAIAEGGIAPGLDANGDYVWAGESFDYETAKEIQNAEGYTENCGTICVGVSHDHIQKLLRDPNIRMVIPYHKSGLNPIVAHMNKIAEFTDYTNDQRTKGKDGKALEKDFDFSKALHDMGDQASPKAVADQYLKWCMANGYTARFSEFAMEDNYYKLLEDFTLYDKDGNYVPQREVRAVFPKADSAFGSMKELIQEGLQEDAVVEGKRDKNLSAIVDEIQRTIPKTEAEIAEEQVAQADRDLEATEVFHSDIKYSERVTDKKTLDFLNKQDTITTYKTMQVVDGKLYPPMAARTNGAYEDYSVLGVWEQATEHPELIKNGNKYKLDKGKGQGSIEAAYNPYMHSSNLVLNDQFSGAYTRDNLVTVECEVPVSELTSGYHAQYAKDSVGWHAWHTGTVAGSLRKARGIERQVFLSRWIKPVRIVPDSEVASMYKNLLNGTDIAVPDNVVTPSLLKELKSAGVKIKESGRVKYSSRDFTYQELTAKSDLKGRVIRANQTVKLMSDGSIDRAWIVSQVFSQCESIQTKAPAPTYFVNVPDIGKNVEITGEGIRHGFIKYQPKNGKPVPQKSLLNARVSLDLPKILRNSIEVNQSDRGDNAEVEFSHILIGVTALEAPNGNVEYYAVRSVVEARKNQGAILTEANVIGKLHAMNAKKIGKPRVQVGTNGTVALAGSSLFDYSVADLLNDVKNEFDDTFSNDVYKHFGMTRKANSFSQHLKYSDRDTAPTFYSHMARVVDGVKQEKLGAASVVNMLRGKGVKAEEIKWSGIETFLEGKKSVTKAELQEFIAGSMLQIEEDVLDNKERPYTEDQQKRLDEYQAKRDEIANRLAAEWKKVTGNDWTIHNAGAGLESSLVNKIIDTNKEHKDASFEGRLLKKLRNDLREVIENNDDFGFDSWKDALRSIHRHRRDFITHYEMSSNDKAIIVKYCNALNAYNELADMISEEDADRMRAIARETDPWNRKIMEVKHEYNEEAAKHMTNWQQYKLKGGKNYREVLFRIPEANYSNDAMYVHWKDRSGVLAHARVQDMETSDGRMLFIEEIQSDWHNEGHKSGYSSEKGLARISELEDQMAQILTEKDKINQEYDAFLTRYWEEDLSDEEYTQYLSVRQEKLLNLSYKQRDVERELNELSVGNDVPDAPFRDTYHEYVLKRLIRMAAEQDYDSIGWTPADIQSDRWSDEYAEGYRIEYDQDIPKFLNKYGKKWGTKVGKTVLDNGTEVWSMAITDSMKESVLHEGQPLYSDRDYQDVVTKAEQQFGTTTDFEEAGFILPSGKMLKFTDDNHRGERIYDHRAIGMAYGVAVDLNVNHGFNYESNKHLDAFVEAGGIRFDPGNLEFNMDAGMQLSKSVPLTAEQEQTIREFVAWKKQREEKYNPDDPLSLYDGPISLHVDFGANANIAVSSSAKDLDAWGVKHLSYEGGQINASRIINDIRHYYRTGETRKPSTIAQFLYSDRDSDSVSNRSLLANALESVAKNDIERKKLQEYKEKISLINAEEENLRALNKQLRIERDPENIKVLRFEANQSANRINTYDRQLLRLEASQPLKDVLTREKKMAFDRGVQRGKDALEKYREKAEKQQQETIKRYQESRERGVENRKKTAMRQKIRGVIRDLDKILNRGNKKSNVKEDMKDFVADALAAAEILFTDNYSNEDMVRNGVGTDLTPEEAKFMNEARSIMDEIANLPTGYDGWMARQEQEFKLKGRLNYRMSKLKDVFVRERARLNKTQVSEVLGNLADSYARLQNSEYAHVQGAYHEAVHEYLKMLQEDVGGTIIKDMTLGQLEELYKAYTMVKTTVHNANRMFADNLKNTREALANMVMFEVHEAGGEHGLWSKAADKLNSFSWNNEKPVYAFERIGSKTLKTLYGNIRKGQDGWAVDIQEANDFRMQMYQKYKHNTWDTQKTYKFTSSSGIDFELNTDQIMSLYAYSKRAQAHDHLLKGGFVFDGNTEVVVNKKGLKMTYLNKNATAYNVSFEILENIISKLTPEQKSFVDDMQEYLSTTMGEKGNEVSMELYGVKLFNEQFYFPLRSAGQYMERAKEADLKKEQGQVNIANSGFSKAVKIKASNPVVLTGFMDVWAGHVNEMSMYHSFVLPMEDFRRVYNYSSPHMEGQPSASVNGVIQNAYGAAATDYIDQLYRDLNGGALTDNRTGPINKLMGLFKKGAVFASASVTIQQPSAVARATALVDIKHFFGPKVDAKRHKALWEEVKQYAPVAVIKEMGFFDTNMGRSATDFLTSEEYTDIKQKAMALVKDESYRDELLSKAPALADELTWCVIWEAVKRETREKNPKMSVKSEEFLRLAGDRFSEVIDKTQVYDSVLARSANMRSKDTGMKMATAFMAEPTTSINMVADALRKGKKGNKKQAARIVGSVVSSVILNSFLVAWVYAARDDDEDETFREKYISAFLSGIKDGVNPATYIPFVKDVVSIMQGYDVERSDMAVISDLWNAWKQLKSDDVSAWRKVEGFVGSICQIFGLPVKNIMRDVRSVFQAYDTIVHGEKNTTRGTAYAIVEGLTGQKPSNPEQLYKALKAGDEKHAARVAGRYDDEKSANAAVRKAITDRYMDDKLTLAQATMELAQHAGMEPDEAYWLMDGWKHKKETGSDDYNKYNAFYEAVKTGKDLKAVIKTYTDNGVKNTTLSGQITSHFKDEYVQMSAAERANIKGYLINAYEQVGVNRKDAEEKLREWDFEAKYGGSYNDIVDDYKNGAISEDTMRSILADKGYSKSDIEDKISDWNVYKIYGYEYSKLDDAYRAGELSREEFRQAMIDNGTFPAKADQAIITYDWMRDHAEYGLEYSDAGKYAHPIENYGYSLADVGLDPDIYLEYKELKKGCKGIDADNDGTADSGTLRAAKFEMIDSLPITNDQKDALAAIDYSMKSVKRYAPWH